MGAIVHFFDLIAEFWESKRANRLFSSLLIITFVFSLLLSLLSTLGVLGHLPFHVGVFTCIHFSFSVLLFIEIIGLVFVIPYSIANSIGKQFEILCLILLRSAFEDFSGVDLSKTIDLSQSVLIKMVTDGIGALLLFFLLAFYYKFQKHRPIVSDLSDAENFIKTKKVIAFLILVFAFLGGLGVLYVYVSTGVLIHFVNNFFLVLIIADLLFMLIAFRYVIHFPDVFRYSAFVLITIFIRLSLASPVYWNTALAVFAGLYAIAVVRFHDLFLQGRTKAVEEKV